LRLARSIRAETGLPNLCLAGGVALNCVANGKIHREKIFERMWIQPAAGDAGGAIGAALAAYHLRHGGARMARAVATDGMNGAYPGPALQQDEIESQLTAAGATYVVMNDDEMIDTGATALAEGRALGWVQGRMEFGPRALGGRSILGDPRSPATVSKRTNPRYHALISRFRDLTGCPVVVNTSFNVRGEPIVCTASDAFRCFMGSEIETLIVGNCVLQKEEQNPGLKLDYKDAFDLD
jgi:predicted NodU family carbamoyl transferase